MSRTIVASILGMRCPRCREGRMFESTTFSFRKPFDMHERCPHCNQNLFPEPGFYYGAMFLSYILSGFFCLGLVAFIHWVLGVALIPSFLILLAVVSFLFVWFFRIARVMWIHIVVGHQPGAKD